VVGQMMIFPMALCRMIENIQDDMSYVLIGAPMWKIQRRQWSWWRRSNFWRRRFNLEYLWRWWSSQERAQKNVYWPKKSRQRKIPTKTRPRDIRKLEQWLWYHVRNIECNSIVFHSERIYMSAFTYEVYECSTSEYVIQVNKVDLKPTYPNTR